VRIFITWLTSLPAGVEMTVKVGIKVFYPDSYLSKAFGWLVNQLPYIPKQTVVYPNSVTVPFETPAFTISASPTSGNVYGTTTYTLIIPLTTALSAGELIGIKFPAHFINKYQANQNTDLNTYVFADSDTIYIEWSSSSTLTIATISNPDY